jgi:hypothetical protein
MGWRKSAAIAAAVFLLASCASYWQPNPLLGRWTMTTPLAPGLVLGTYEFRRSSMTAWGVTQQVEYSVEGNNVLVIPKGIGVGLELTVEDDDTARLSDPVTGGLVMLRRLQE